MAGSQPSIFDTPAYSAVQAAHYVGVPGQTLMDWISKGLISVPVSGAITFNNLAEAHVLKSMRRKHGLSLQSIRKALEELAHVRKNPHPLLDENFETDGVDLCIRDQDGLINLSKRSQREFREIVSIYMHRIERDKSGRVASLYPFIVADQANEPKHISISPAVSFGKPVLAGTGISTSVIVGRFKARDSVADLAREYEVDPAVLEDAIRWEMNRGRAA